MHVRSLRRSLLGGGPQPAPPPELQRTVESFHRTGYAVLRSVIDPDLCDAFWQATDQAVRTQPNLQVVSQGLSALNKDRPEPFGPLYSGVGDPDRIIDIEAHVDLAPSLMLHSAIAEFLRPVLAGPPACIQTLAYSHSSQQAAHSDKFLVSPRAVGDYDRGTLTAAWIALEASTEENGALVLWPGSHLLEKPRLVEDLGGDYGAYAEALEIVCTEAGIKPVRFFAEKGDVLFWHGDLVHGGGKILNPEKTRKSLVCHYANCGPWPRSSWWQRRAVAHPNGFYFLPKEKTLVRKVRDAVRRRFLA